MRREEMVHNFDSRIRRRDGSVIWISENARAVRDPDGLFLYYEGTVEDITADVEAEETIRRALQEAQEAARSKAAFLAAMSHELKTPLNAVIGFSELMLHEVFGPVEEPRYRSYLGDIHENGRRLLTMINEILDLTRVQGGLLTLDESTVALNEVIDDVWNSLIEANTKAPYLQRDFAANLPLLRADPKRIRQVLSHILSNAMKFTPPTGHVRVSARVNEFDGLDIVIADTGIGMEPERIPAALEPFKQLDGRLARRFEGVGLGLPLALALVRLHGGELRVESALGKGTTVSIDFPRERVVELPKAKRA
jgi:signal transduction histidine kinase